MGLTLVAGPANAGKVALLLERYLAALEREPVLIVPTRSDVERVTRELLSHRPALFGGSIGTWDDVFERIAAGDERSRAVATDTQRLLAARRALGRVSLNGLGRSARFGGFADELVRAVSELEASLLEPEEVDGDLQRLYRAYRDELETLALWDRDLLRARAVARLASSLDAWHGEPVFAYGFEDLTAAEWGLLEALAGRTDVTVTLPYEPGRAVFASLRTTADDLAGLAAGRIEELPPQPAPQASPAIAHVERALFVDSPGPGPPLQGAVRFLEGAGARGALELVADEILALVRGGTAPDRIAVVCPSLERWRAAIETSFGTLGVPYALEGRIRLAATPFGEALLGVLRYAWLGGERGELFAYLRSPFSGLTRAAVDFVEGRLRGRAIAARERIDETMKELRGASLPALDALRTAESPLAAARSLAGSMAGAAYDARRPRATDEARADLRAHEACVRLLDELEHWERVAGEEVRREDLVAALERAPVRAAATGEAGRVVVLDLLGARTRRFDAVFVLGLEEGSLPRRGGATPFLGDDVRRRLGRRLQRPDPVARDRYLFYAACAAATRRLTLVREAATDEGSPREPGPFWEEVRALFAPDDVARWTRRRPLSALTWPLEGAPTERERLRALALLAAGDDADAEAAEALARANGWSRRLDRARSAFRRPTRLRHPLVLEQLRDRTVFPVTELERFADCSSAWLFDRVIEPRTIDAEVDPKLRGSVAHTALFRFFAGLPKELGSDRVDEARVEDAVRFMRRCLEQAVDGVRMEMTAMQRRELREGLWRDLEQVVRDEAAGDAKLVPRRFEVSFGSERSAPELQRGLELGDGLTLSGKIDRIDVDPFSTRGIVQDYKAGKSAHSASQIEKELRLQIPLYMLVLRDLVGIEPLGGVYRPLAGDRKPRGLLRAEAREEVLAGFSGGDYRGEEEFWAQVEGAREAARGLAGRLREGDVRHDPRGDGCPSWCDLWPMCRVKRP
jgi:ATP-dependent helicase/nuclease subunit B